jgi:fibrillarin-like rRNA methylase
MVDQEVTHHPTLVVVEVVVLVQQDRMAQAPQAVMVVMEQTHQFLDLQSLMLVVVEAELMLVEQQAREAKAAVVTELQQTRQELLDLVLQIEVVEVVAVVL